jgi:hypothetical protein
MSRATDDILAGLHGAMAAAMAKKLASGEFTASDLNVIRQFLKDNGINSDGERDDNLKKLADDLPDDIDNVVPLYGA